MSSKNKKGKKRKKNKFKFVQDVSNIERDDEPFREVFMDEDEKDEPEEEEIELLDLDEDEIVEEIKNNASSNEDSSKEENNEFDESLSLINDSNSNDSDSYSNEDLDEIDFLDRTSTNLDEIDFLDKTNSLNINYDEKEEESTKKEFNVFSDNIFDDDDSSSQDSYYDSETSNDQNEDYDDVGVDIPEVSTDDYGEVAEEAEESTSYESYNDEREEEKKDRNGDVPIEADVSYSIDPDEVKNGVIGNYSPSSANSYVDDEGPLESYEIGESEEKRVVKGIHFSFQMRVATSVICIILLLGAATVLILRSVLSQEIKEIGYVESTTADYSACLITNDPYNTKCLDSKQKYDASQIDKFKAQFTYLADFDEFINYNLSYHVVLVSRIYDRYDSKNVIYEDEDVVVDKTALKINSDTGEFDINVDIDYKKYNKFVIDYIKKYSTNSEASFDVVLYVEDDNETRKVASINVPLNKKDFKASSKIVENQHYTATVVSKEWTDVDTCSVMVGSVFVLIAMLVLVRFTKLVMSTLTKKSAYDTELQDILNTYDRYIVVARGGYVSALGLRPIRVDSFDDLLELREKINRPIIYSKVNNVKSEFIVEDEDKIYKFVMKEADMK